MAPEYQLLQKDLPAFNGFATPLGNISASIGDIFAYLWLVGIVLCLLAAAGVIGVGGLRLTTVDSASKAAEIKANMLRAIWGTIGILGLWLFINQVNPDMLRGEISFKPLPVGKTGTVSTGSSTTPGGGGTPIPPTPLPTGACVKGTPCPDAMLQSILADEDRVRGLLNGEVNASKCTSVGQKNCTNVGLMATDAINMIIALKAACACKVVVSGGTEWWSHSTHGPGALTVDLQIRSGVSEKLDAFLKKQPTSPGSSGCVGSVVYTWNGWRFCDEQKGAYAQTTGRHWHVSR